MMQVFMAAFCWLQPDVPGLNQPCGEAGDVVLLGLADLHVCIFLMYSQRLVLALELPCLRQLHHNLSMQLDIANCLALSL